MRRALILAVALAACSTRTVELFDAAPALDLTPPPDQARLCYCRYACDVRTSCPQLVGAGEVCGGDSLCTGGVPGCATDGDCQASPGGLCAAARDATSRCGGD